MPRRTLPPLLLFLISAAARADPLPDLVVTTPGVAIDHSCRVVIPPGTVLPATDDSPALRIAADDITLEFADGSILRGAPDDRPLDQFRGTGIRLDGHARVTIRNPSIAGYRCAIHASRADFLTIDAAHVLSGFARHLKSTPQAEDASDWLWPHKNDDNQWLSSYGAAVYVEDSVHTTIRAVSVRRAQNGVILDRVNDSRVYDCDCSFLSGWGLALWRSSRNAVSRNAFDFCVRGYSHGVYNRGQDSAGILCFEQSSSNIFAENSATHSGDAFFGFAGRDALGESWIDARTAANLSTDPIPETVLAARKGAGCNDNLLLANDFSYAAAHGIEMTFSRGNRFVNNRVVGNAICGVWGGFSSHTLITGNTFESNGDAGYGAERGAINIEHGRDNRIVGNIFSANALGVRLWAGADTPLAKTPWGRANAEPGTSAIPSARTTIDRNSFSGEPTALHVRNSAAINFSSNSCTRVRLEIDAERGTAVDLAQVPPIEPPALPQGVPGQKHPVGARGDHNGREHIIMTEWGPWDFTTPFVRLHRIDPAASTHIYQVFGVAAPLNANVRVEEGSGAKPCRAVVTQHSAGTSAIVPIEVRVSADDLGPGVWPYVVHLAAPSFAQDIRGIIVNASWSLTCFPWTHDPLADPDGWRADAKSDKAVTVPVRALDFPLGYKGPSRIGIAPEITAANFGANHYGLIARASLPLGKGRWAIRTLSDDGLRVIVDGTPVIDRWNIHAPTPDTAVLTFDEPHTAEIVVEYFQNDGHAVLTFAIEPAPEAP